MVLQPDGENGLSAIRPPTPRQSLADAVYDALLEAIVTGALPGHAELNAVAVSDRLGVSRTPVMQALARLATEGLVEQHLNRSASVVPFAPGGIAELYEVRGVLEGYAAELAAARIARDDVAGLRRVLRELARGRGDDAWIQHALSVDDHFHRAIAGACGNERLEREIGRYRRLVAALCRMTATVENLAAATKEHLRVVTALEKRDGDAARGAMIDHISRRAEGVLRQARDRRPQKASQSEAS